MKHFYLLAVLIYCGFVANAQTLPQENHLKTNSQSTNTPTHKISVIMEECVVLDSTFILAIPYVSQNWVTRKTINEYNEKGNETSSILFHLNDSLKLWKKLRVESTIYFDLSKEEVDSWVENDSVKFQEKKKFKFDIDGKIFSTINYDFDENCKQWKVKSIINSSGNFNPLKRSSIYLYFSRNSDDYDLEQSFVTFNRNNQITETVDLVLDNESNEKLNNHHKTINKYDSHGNRTSVINCRWIPKNNKFTNSYVDKLTTYKYDSKGRIIEEVKYNGFNKARKQLPQRKESYSYDENGNKVEWVTSAWEEKSKNWVLVLKSNFKYNTYGLNTEISHYKWNPKTNEWHLTPEKGLFYYSNHRVTEVANPNSVTEFGIYPAANGKTLKILGSKWGDDINIYDANNKLKISKKNSPFPVTLDVSRLPKGTYTIKVSNKESVRIARLNII
jgi:hypothetical protein